MRNAILFLVIISSFLLFGCLGEQKSYRECPDGSIAVSLDKCPKYTCSDGMVTNNPDLCDGLKGSEDTTSTQTTTTYVEPSKPKLPSSFCYSLVNVNPRKYCNENVQSGMDDDQRLRDYYTHIDGLTSAYEELGEYEADMSDDIDAWNDAESISEAKPIYNSYYDNVLLYSNEVEGIHTRLDNYESFLNTNKAYLDGIGMNTQSELNYIISARTSLKSSVIQAESNLRNMGETIELATAEQEKLNDLLSNLMKLALLG